MQTQELVPVQEDVRDWRRPATVGYVIIILAFGIFGSWAAFARLDSAVMASGVVTVETSRKTVAHLEGGIVRQLLVQEGQHVEQGDVLVKLDNVSAQAGAEMYHNQLMSAVAQEARLVAEGKHASDIEFPAELLDDKVHQISSVSMVDQRKQFQERRASIEGQTAILEARIKQLNEELEGLAAEKTGAIRQRQFIDLELVDMRMLGAKNLVPKTRVLSLEREDSRLEGVIGRSTADAAKAHASIGEARLQIEQLRQKFAEEVNSGLLDIRQKISDLRERSRVSSDVLSRVEVRAPVTGMVQNVKVATVGGIIRPGEPLLEIIPDGDELIVNAQVSPSDVDTVRTAVEAEVRFSAFHGKILPIIMGRVQSLSHDSLVNEQTRQPYFLARISVDQSQIAKNVRERITAGMPVEVIIPTGERTMADYLWRPLQTRMRKALREQ